MGILLLRPTEKAKTKSNFKKIREKTSNLLQ